MRPERAKVFLNMAAELATLATCPRRQVGCIFTDEYNRIISSGYNGVPSGMPHCTAQPCEGAKLASGTGLDSCLAIHAEINAMALCSDVKKVKTIYLTCSPCVACVKALLTTSATKLYFTEKYADTVALDMWTGTGREWIQIQKSLAP